MPIKSTTRLFQCLRCHRQVMICQQCDRGQRYCAHGCRRRARKETCKRAQIKYQNSRKGRLNNAQRQHRFRRRQKEKAKKTKKVTDQTSLPKTVNDLLTKKRDASKKAASGRRIPPDSVCHFCGCRCGPLFRVGFLKKRTTYPYQSKTAVGETRHGH